jgi:hypothetical protein
LPAESFPYIAHQEGEVGVSHACSQYAMTVPQLTTVGTFRMIFFFFAIIWGNIFFSSVNCESS